MNLIFENPLSTIILCERYSRIVSVRFNNVGELSSKFALNISEKLLIIFFDRKSANSSNAITLFKSKASARFCETFKNLLLISGSNNRYDLLTMGEQKRLKGHQGSLKLFIFMTPSFNNFISFRSGESIQEMPNTCKVFSVKCCQKLASD